MKTTNPARARESARPRDENSSETFGEDLGDRADEGVDCTIHMGSGNVFADVGYPDAEERSAKADISIRIQELIKGSGFTQAQAADRMGVTQPEVSQIVRGRVGAFKIDRLIRCVQALGQDVQINLPRTTQRDSGVTVLTSATDQPRGVLQVMSQDIHWVGSASPTRAAKRRSPTSRWSHAPKATSAQVT